MIRHTDRYLGDEERSVGVPLSLPQGESPRRTTAQRHADVIPGAHAAHSSSAKPPQHNHRAVSRTSSTLQKKPKTHLHQTAV